MVSSRLAKRQQKQLMKQTLLIGGIALVILVTFIFLIVPQIINFAANFLGGGPITESQDNIPPQTPVLSSPVTATFSARLPISGVGEPNAEAVLVLNGEELDKIDINDQGQFEFDVPLTEGENQLVVYSIDPAGNESVKTKVYQVELDTTPPPIEITQPTDGQTIELRKNQVTTIKGSTESKAKVMVNGRLIYAATDGQFSLSYQLQEGKNKLNFTIEDRAGNISQKEILVTFRF